MKGGFLERGSSRKGDCDPLYQPWKCFSAVMIKNYRNQGKRQRNWEKDIRSQHCGKMILNIMTL